MGVLVARGVGVLSPGRAGGWGMRWGAAFAKRGFVGWGGCVCQTRLFGLGSTRLIADDFAVDHDAYTVRFVLERITVIER